MAKYSIGSPVVNLVSGQHGTVINVYPSSRGRQLYKVCWPSGNSDELEVNLSLDCDISDPYERCANGLFGSYSEYTRRNTTFKIKNSNNSTISSLKASKTLFRAYQFKPLLKFLNSPNRRLLVADEVGLGKTIEAGHIMLELKARGLLRNVLIVCPKSLQEKWKAELMEKFGLPFTVFESPKDLISELDNPRGNVRAIVNYEKIRMKKDDNEDSKSSKKKGGKKKRVLDSKNNFVDFLLTEGCRFSMVLCDEAHKLRNSSTQTYKGAEVVMSMADSCVLLTATPIMISTENLYNLLHLLDNTRYFNPQIFENLLQQNKPFVRALSELNKNEPLSEICKRLFDSEIHTIYSADEREILNESTTVGKRFSSDPLFVEIVKLMNGEDTLAVRARLQYLISSMSIMNNVFSRTRKREVTTDCSQPERKPHLKIIELSSFEREEYDKVLEEYVDDNSHYDYEEMDYVLTRGGSLGLVQKKRQVASSVFAYLNKAEDLERGIDAYSEKPDAKIDVLVEIIEEVFSHGTKKLVVFALFRKTLDYIRLRLKSKGYGCLVIHGQVDNRADILEEFKTDPRCHILLSSEVGSEGLDMQFCDSMVNYDLPWNPMVVEQRIGRIDRFGQLSPIVNIYNLVVADSIQEIIYTRLLDRIGIFRDTIGDMEAILDANVGGAGSVTIQDIYNNLEKELYTSQLTKEEQQRKIDEVKQAIENEKENIRQLEEGLTNTLTNDAYFRDEINRVLYNNAYVTEYELKNYLESIINQELTTCCLEEVGPEVYDFKLPLNNLRVLTNFLTSYQPIVEESAVASTRFKTEVSGLDSFRITFSQTKAYDNRKLTYVNMYHPIIQACLKYFVDNDDKTKTTFCYAIPQSGNLESGKVYYMALYQLSTGRLVQGVKKHTEVMFPILYDIEEKEVVNDDGIAEKVFGTSQILGMEQNPSNDYVSQDIIGEMRYALEERVAQEVEVRTAELKAMVESERFRNEQQTADYYRSRIANLESKIIEWEGELKYLFFEDKERRRKEGAIRLQYANIAQLEKERDEHLEQINLDPQIEISKELVSISLVKIQ